MQINLNRDVTLQKIVINSRKCVTMMPENIKEHLEDINFCVAAFDIDAKNYKAFSPSDLGISGDESNKIYLADGKIPEKCTIKYEPKAKNCKIFLGHDVQLKGCKLTMKSENSVLYIGKESSLNNVSIAILCKGDFVVVGEGVAVRSTSVWSTGLNPGKANNGIIVGDHCLMSSEIVIRPADGHPIIDIETGEQLNISSAPIIIEPYVWVGQRAAIMKNVRIGACSILSFNAVVTKSCEKFSALGGVPAIARSVAGKMWLRNKSKEAKILQKHYELRFSSVPTATVMADDA